MPILKDDVQILRVREQSNSSQIAVAFGRRLGQFHVMMKGSRRWPKKGFEGGFDLLSRGELLAYPRPDEQLWIFKEWDERARPAIGQSYRMLAAGSYLGELTEALTRHTSNSTGEDGAPADDTSARLFDLLAASAEMLAERTVHSGALLLSFTLRALEIEGVLIPLSACHLCGKKFVDGTSRAEVAWLSTSGLECRACVDLKRRSAVEEARNSTGMSAAHQLVLERGLWLGLEAQRALLQIQRTLKPVKISEFAADQLGRTLVILVHGALERDLRTLSYAMKLVKGLK